MKSTYSLPSRSHTRDPRPRSNTTGPGAYTAAPRVFRKHGRVHIAGTNAVDANPLPPVINSHGFGQQHDAAFRSAIRDGLVAAHQSPSGTVVDDHSSSLRDHWSKRVFRHQERAFQIDVNLQVPFFFRAFERSLREKDAGVVKQNVEASKRTQRLVHCAPAFGGLANIRTNEDRLPAGFENARGDSVAAALIPTRNRYLRAFSRKQIGH